MSSFNIESVFTNLPLDETIDLCTNKMFGGKTKCKRLSKKEFKCLLKFAVKDSFFLFNGIDCVAMGSHLGPTLENECVHLGRNVGK